MTTSVRYSSLAAEITVRVDIREMPLADMNTLMVQFLRTFDDGSARYDEACREILRTSNAAVESKGAK